MREYDYFVDTNIFLRTLLKDEKRTFNDCLKFLRQIKKKKIKAFTSNLVLAEVNWTLLTTYQFPKEKTIEGLNSILKLKNLKIIDNFNPNIAIELYKKFPIKFIDALIASNPKIFKKEITIISYDKDFDKLNIKRKEPKKALKEI